MWILASSRVSQLQVWRRLCTWRQMSFPTYWGRRKAQQEVEERWCERISSDIEGVFTIGLCISRFLSEKNLFYVNLESLDQNTPSDSPKCTWHEITIRERKGPSRGVAQKCAPRERSPCAHKATFCIPGEAKVMSTPVAVGFGKKHLVAQEFGQNHVLFSYWSKGNAGSSLTRPEEREFVVDSGASMHMMRKKEISTEEMGKVKRSRSPTVVLTANGEVHTHEEAQVYVHDLDQFVTVQVLEGTLAVLWVEQINGRKWQEGRGWSVSRYAIQVRGFHR